MPDLAVLARAYAPPRIVERPTEAHAIVRYLRDHGWTYEPGSRWAWKKRDIEAIAADDALSFELGEVRVREVRRG